MIIRPDTGSWSGFADSFGERATAVDVNGRSVDLLRLVAAFTPASQALADRIALLDLHRPAVSRAIALERDEPSSRLVLISEHVPGVRLSELLEAAVQRSVVPDLGAALFVMRRLLTLAESLNAATGLARFSIAPDRIVITPHGRVVIVEPVLAAAAETVGMASNDIAGIAIAGMSIMLGHLIEDAERIDPLSPALQDAADVAAIRAGHRFSTALRLWFDRAITADPTLSFPGFRQARLALPRVRLARESGCDASRRALKVFLTDLAIGRLTEVEAGALEVARLREIRATRLARWKGISAPDEEWISVEDELFAGDDSRVPVETIRRGTLVELPDDVGIEKDLPAWAHAEHAVGIDSLAEPEMPPPVEEPLDALLVEEQPEAAPTEETIEAAPVEVSIAAASVEETFETALVEARLIEAEPTAATIEATLVEGTETAPMEEPLEAIAAEVPFATESVEETLEAAPVEEEPIEADPAPSQGSWLRSMARQLGLASAEPPLQTGVDAPPEAVPLESLQAEHSTEPLVADPVLAPWSSPVSTEPEFEEAGTESGDTDEEELDEVDEELLEIEAAEPPAETLEAWPAEEAEPLAVDTLGQSRSMEAAIETPIEHPAEVTEDLTAVFAEDDESTPTDAEAGAESEILEHPVESLAEPVSAEPLRSWTAPVRQESLLPGTEVAAQLTAAYAVDPNDSTEPDLQVETIDAPLEQDEPVAPVDESIAARLSEDAHTSWILSITEQLGRMRRREQELLDPPPETTAAATDDTPPVDPAETGSSDESGETAAEVETLFSDAAADEPAVQTAHHPFEQAATPHGEERTEQPAWAMPQPAPWDDDASAARAGVPFPAELTAVPVPAGLVDLEYAPHSGVLHEQAADARPHEPAVQPAKVAGPRTIAVPARRWARAAATIFLAGLAIAIVAALAIAGLSYYRSVTAPGTLAVDSTPRGSEVLVDGTARGITPLTLTLQPGDYLLTLRRNGLTRQFPIAVTPGAQLSHQLDWSTVKATGTLAISSTPSQARVTVDGKERGVTPLTVSDLPVGMREIVIESSAGTVRRDVRIVAGSRVSINETITFGWIAAFAPIELQIYEGTRLLGTTQEGRIMAPPGRHELDFVNTRLGFRERRGIDVNPGMTTAVNIATGVGIVRVTAPAGADVLVDGVLFGDTPLRELRLPIGTHEIVLRHPQLGEQRVSVTVGASAPTEVSVDFTK